jgi:hypothetical protein
LAACLKNMTPLIDPDRRLISEMVDLRRAVPPIASRMLRFRNWKIWQTFDNDGFSRPVVFDLAEDPHEHSDLGASIPESSLLGALQSDWQPSADRASAAAMRDDLVDVIQRYGRLIDPESADVLPFPDHSIESDVVLVTDAFAAAR